MRQSIITQIFGTSVLPTKVPIAVTSTSPLSLVGVASVDKLTLDMGDGEINYAWRHKPATSCDRLAIVHQGHDNSYASIGVDMVAQKLINAGFDVVLVGMPGFCGNDGLDHSQYTSLRPFILPTIAVLNLLASSFDNVSMIGISGGGWTTVICAAIDPRIKFSCPVAGSLPSTFKPTPNDWEQGALSHICDYQLLYALGCAENGRRQRQVLIRAEPSTLFSYLLYGPNYKKLVVDVVNGINAIHGGGVFDWYEDVSQSQHTISLATINQAILPLLGVDPGVPYERFIKVQDSGFSRTGNWFYRSETVDGMYHSLSPWDGVAKWTFDDVPNGIYDIFISWSTHPNRSTMAPYRVFDGAVQLQSFTLNQEGAPSGYTAPNGQQMKKLTTVQISSGSCTVQLNAVANAGGSDFVVASTARLVQVS